MKSLRTLLMPAGLVAVLAFPAGALAQTAPPPASGAAAQPGARTHHRGFMHAMQGLNLSADQQSRLKALMTQYRAAHPKGSEPDAQARQTLHQQMMDVLTPAQQAQFKSNMQAGLGTGERESGEAAHPGGGMMHRFDQLNLSADQRSKIEALLTQFRSAHPKGSARDPQAMAGLRQQINAILTPAQQQQLQQLHGRDDESQEGTKPPQR